ncbi:MAG TPA: hypothetical protein PK528_11990, partial [Syntrophorhabdus sp.]|nr:hypothetical protein [Syntrophorhabdus sp.]
MSLSENLINRKWLALRVRAEIVGPDPTGNEQHINLYGEPIKYSWENFRKPRKQINGEEIIWQDPPSKRYGAGILYPLGILDEAETNKLEEEKQEVPDIDPDGLQDVDEKLEKMAEKKATKIRIAMDDSEDYAVTLSNAFKPSAIGLSFLADLALEDKGFRVEVVNVSCLGHDELQEIPAGTYKPVKAEVGNLDGKQYERTQWLRVPLLDNEGKYPHIDVSSRELLASKGPIKRKLNTTTMSGLEIVVVHRGGYSRMTSSQRLITVSLVNRTHPDAGSIDAHCLFQVGIRVKGISNSKWIHPYPETEIGRLKDRDPLADEYINLLLYRQHKTFAIGHGCAADWPGSAPEMVSEVWSDILPTFETPSTSADLFIIGEDGNKKPIKVSMQKLAGLDPDDDGQQEIEDLLKAYEGWILSLKKERVGVPAVPEELQKTANGLVERCENCLKRMRDGVAFLKEDSEIARSACHAFRLANYAMLIAQMRATTNVRKPSLTKDGHIVWTPAILERDPAIRDSKLGYWRAFQIAFLLMSLRAIAEPDCTERDIVDLIWFPTGGGKTEAYLGLTVYTVFFNRLSNRNPGGTDVLMRYTLRLLTAQQFQRAALLFCAMEHLRRKDKRLGEKPFRIGLWVGGSASPNTRKEALGALEKLEKDPESENPFVLLKCPWCGAKFGPSSSGEEGRKRRGQGGHIQKTGIPSVLGYHRYTKTNRHPTTVVFRCNDGACEFGTASAFQKPSPPLPIVIIDDDLLDDPPNLVIGTVDKFAMLAWKPEVRRLFGISDNGQHDGLPPSLIIQDELH